MKRRHVVLSPEALADLRWIYDTIASAAGNATAMRYIERIEVHCQGLDHASERGTRRDDLRPGLRVIGFERRVTVTFTVQSDQVVILRVFYGGANWENEL
ncbi:type II toxin-antitoxin system RelE/ParE family toxin [Mesorhizobium loti]|uniref:Type II toxin-antitoxin system RelE/ParE family toxin n=1 Tax=Mesorhizobium loti R88b TaxID=935548 RepID=A0A6M7WEB9_RHILI|nr:type II toxin-antitoxin system RelE/ParE family toxin [Mesorhizobium loti]QKD00285.1 type II toxin-antitoxin system RelE/ParE family toxin [Mesorhizobium loti R88b]